MKRLSIMARYVPVVFILCFLSLALLPPTRASAPLADAISSVLNNTWASDPASVSIATIFGKDSPSAFDSSVQSLVQASSWQQVAWCKEIASEDGYSSATINNAIADLGKPAGVAMTGSLPETYNGMWLVYDRSFVPLYDVLGWSKSTAISNMQAEIQQDGGKPLLAFGGQGWYYAGRYYDEWIEDLDIFLKMGDRADAAAMWAGVNSAPPVGNWMGTYYSYRPDETSVMECEVGFFAAVIANYEVTVGGIPNFDRVSTDLYTKLLASGWGSSLWGAPSQMQHATSNSQLREQNTVGGIEALQMYYCIANSAYRTAFDGLLLGSKPAWQYLVNAGGWGTPGPDDSAETAALLFLYGIIPDTGSLAVPANEWHYEDWTSMMPSSLFRFDYGTQTIQIPVHVGNIKFDFGSSIASYDFPSDGVYQVHFSSDWNSVTSAVSVGALTGFNFLSASSTPPPVQGYGSIQVSGSYNGQAVAFTGWYDSTSEVSVPASGYTFASVPTGSHTVYGSFNGISRSGSVAISSEGQTATYSFDFSAQQQKGSARPIWWPEPLPWPLPSILGTVVSSPVDMLVAYGAAFALVVVGISKLMKSKPKSTSAPRKRYVMVEDD